MQALASHEDIKKILKKHKPIRLTLPVPQRIDHADHMIKTALEGHTKLAADHVLHPEMRGKLLDLISSLIRRLGILLFDNKGLKDEDRIVTKFRVYDFILEMIWNLTGIERRWAGFKDDETNRALNALINALKEWESRERREFGSLVIIRSVIETQLDSMRIVNKGNSMLAWMAREVEKSIDENMLVESYVKVMSDLIKNNFYYIAYDKRLCKFGNDYALGLRWLRHLGYVQVSTNPALAARAYDDNPELWDEFKDYVREVLLKEHPEWFKDVEKYADEIAMEATRFCLLDNFYVFRIPFLLSKYHDGMVSYQLNPLIAGDVEKSIRAAREFAQNLERDLMIYDSYLLWGYKDPIEKGRPNLVIKVAAGYPAAIEIARRLNSMGIGQNITVSYSVSQEILIGIAAMEGMAIALKKGIIPTQTYDTNMGGRLEDHLRETIASRILIKALEKLNEEKREVILNKLSEDLGLNSEKILELKKKSWKEWADFLVSKRVLGRNMLKDAFINALVKSGAYKDHESAIKELTPIENAIRLSGTYVAQRVYEIFFSPWNRPKWLKYLINKFGISKAEAEFIMDRIDLLPASKRKPIDTLYTFSCRNVTNTEFPNHQLAVMNEVKIEEIEEYRESIMKELDKEPLKLLMKFEDFIKAFEASPELNELLISIGIKKNYGNRGLKITEWPKYGPCVKTLNEFSNAYLKFREKVIKNVKEII